MTLNNAFILSRLYLWRFNALLPVSWAYYFELCLRHWIISLSLWSLLTKVRAAAYKDLVQHWLDICHCNLQLKQKKLKQIPTSVTANYYNNILNIDDEWRNKTEPKGTRQTPQKYWLVYLNLCQSYVLNVPIMSESEKTTIQQVLARFATKREVELFPDASLLFLPGTCVEWIAAVFRRVYESSSQKEQGRRKLQKEPIRKWWNNPLDVTVFLPWLWPHLIYLGHFVIVLKYYSLPCSYSE